MTEPIRLVQITHDLAIGGLQQVVVNLCRAIDRTRFDVTVLCLRALGPLTQEIEKLGVEVILLPQKKTGTDYFSFLKVSVFLRENKIQVIHTHNTQPLVDGVMGCFFSGCRCRIVHTDHARQFPDKKRYMIAEWLMSHFVYKMVGVSPQTTENLHKYEKISNSKLLTIKNGIDADQFYVAIDKVAKRKSLGIISGGPVVGIISRIEKVKGITNALQSLPYILKYYPEVMLVIVGEGSELGQLQQEAKKIGVNNNVIFTGSRLDVPEILQALDLYLMPSLSEGLPMGLLESMASGCPIVASSIGGIPSVVKHEESAMLIPPGDHSALATTVVRLLDDHKLQKKISINAKDIFNKHYTAEHMTRKYCELYLL